MQEKSRSGLALALGGLALLIAGGSAQAGEGGLFCHCPPPLKWCSEQAPCIKFKCACPRPVCDPCDLQHYGYYLTCWHPWPFQPNWTHCQTIPPGAALPPPAYPPYPPRAPQDRRLEPTKEGEFPTPRLSDPKDQMESPQVRNTGYRVNEQPPVRQAPRRLPEEPSAPVQMPQATVGYRLDDAPSVPAQQPQTNRPAVRFIR